VFTSLRLHPPTAPSDPQGIAFVQLGSRPRRAIAAELVLQLIEFVEQR
jgi:hypothetical protein